MSRTATIPVILLIISSAALSIGPSVRADSPATQAAQPASQPFTQPDRKLPSLVDQLANPDFAARDAAQKTLEHMGPEAEPGLRQMLQENLPAEARARIQSALRRISEDRQFGPSVITLHYKDAPMLDVLDDFATQAGAEMGTKRPPFRALLKDRKATVDLDHVNFWTALQSVETASGLHIRPGEGDGSLILDNQGGQMEFQSKYEKNAGPCLIVPQMLDWNLNLMANANDNSTLSFRMMAMVEPKLHVIGTNNMRWLTECVDEKGHSLLPDANPNFFGGGFGGYGGPGRYSYMLMTNLKPYPGMGKTIARIRGNLRLNVQIASQVFEVDNIRSVKNDHHIAGDSSLDIQEVTNENGQWQVHFSVVGPMANQNFVGAQQIIASVRLFDDKQQLLQQTGCTTSFNGRALSLIIGFMTTPNIGPPQKLRWELTTQTRQISVPFELNNIALPGAE